MKDSKIKKIKAREILDSRGNPTIEVELETDLGSFLASVPSGASKGRYEAVELRDADGRGVKKAIENVEKIIAPVLLKESFIEQKKIDEILINLDGTKNKSRLGANATLAVSMAICRAGAAENNLSLFKYISQLYGNKSGTINLPRPSFNLIEGGRHAENNLAFQEFMIVPQKLEFEENLKIGKTVYQELKKNLESRFGKINVELSFEGAFSAPIKEIHEAMDFIMAAVENVGHKNDIKIALDIAASEFFENGNYRVVDELRSSSRTSSLERVRKNFNSFGFANARVGKEIISKEKLLEFYENLVKKFPIIFGIEDPFFQEDFEGFAEINKEMGEGLLIFGDDLTVSNVERIKMAQEKKACSGLILKPNQIGTVTETLEAAKLVKDFGWKIMVSNRAGETKDDFIADLAAGIGAEFIKSGAPFPKERMAKYNRLVKIEEELHKN